MSKGQGQFTQVVLFLLHSGLVKYCPHTYMHHASSGLPTWSGAKKGLRPRLTGPQDPHGMRENQLPKEVFCLSPVADTYIGTCLRHTPNKCKRMKTRTTATHNTAKFKMLMGCERSQTDTHTLWDSLYIKSQTMNSDLPWQQRDGQRGSGWRGVLGLLRGARKIWDNGCVPCLDVGMVS